MSDRGRKAQGSRRKKENPNAQKQARQNLKKAGGQVKQATKKVTQAATQQAPKAGGGSRGGGSSRVSTPQRVQTVRSNNNKRAASSASRTPRVAQRNTGRLTLPQANQTTSTTTSINRDIRSTAERMNRYLPNGQKNEHRTVYNNRQRQRQEAGTDNRRIKSTAERMEEMQAKREHGRVHDNTNKRINPRAAEYARNTGVVKTETGVAKQWAGAMMEGAGFGAKLGTLYKSDKVNHAADKLIKAGDRLSQSGQKQTDEVKKALGNKALGFGYNALAVEGQKMMMDVAASKLSRMPNALPIMGIRSAGTEYMNAKKSGATEKQAAVSALANAGIEMGSEKMFGVTKLFRSAGGKGIMDDVIRKGIDKTVAKYGAGKAAKIVQRGGTGMVALIGEGLEEMVAEGLEPKLANEIYLESIGQGMRDDIRTGFYEESENSRRAISQMAKQYGISEDEATDYYLNMLNDPDYAEKMRENLIKQGVPKQEANDILRKHNLAMSQLLTGSDKLADKSINDYVKTIYSLNPAENNTLFSNDPWNDKSQAIKDIFSAGAAGGLLGGVFGGASIAANAVRGEAVKDYYGEDGVNNLVKKVMESDDGYDAAFAQVIGENIKNGKGVMGEQVLQLQEAAEKQAKKDKKREDAAVKVIDNAINDKKYVSTTEVARNPETNEVITNPYTGQPVTQRHNVVVKRFNEMFDKAQQAMEEFEGVTVKDTEEVPEAVGAVASGIVSAEYANAFTVGHPEYRAAYEATTGETLPVVRDENGAVDAAKTNAATRDYIYAKMSENSVQLAREATEEAAEVISGEMMTYATKNNYSQKAVEALGNALGVDLDDPDINMDNVVKVQKTTDAFNFFYNAGRSGMELSDALKYKKFDYASTELKKMAYNIGADELEEPMEGMDQSRVQVDTDVDVPLSQIRMAVGVSNMFGANVRIVDPESVAKQIEEKKGVKPSIEDIQKRFNGSYDEKTGEIYIIAGTQLDFSKIISHENDHHLKRTNPEKYAEYRDAVREYLKDTGQYDRLMAEYGALYAGEYEDKSEEEQEEYILEEIMADHAWELWQSPELAEKIAEKDPSVLQAMMQSLKSVIAKFKALLYTMVPGSREARVVYWNLNLMEDVLDKYADLLVVAAYNQNAEMVEESEELRKSITPETVVDENGNVTDEADKAYMQAAKAGRIAECQMYVDAMYKGLGYEHAYHGTDSFGFTWFDLGKMDDERSIFGTDSIQTAATYTTAREIRRINEGENEYLSIYDMLDDYLHGPYDFSFTQYLDEYPELESAINDLADSVQGYMYYMIEEHDVTNTLIEHLEANEYTADYNLEELPEDLISDLEWLSDVLDDFWDRFQDEAVGGIYEVYIDLGYNPLVFDAEGRKWGDIPRHLFDSMAQEIREKAKEKALPFDEEYKKYKEENQSDNILSKEEFVKAGLSNVYTPEEIGLVHSDYMNGIEDGYSYNIVDTRDVSAYARENGYTGVRITNLIDEDVYGPEYGPATIYIVFNSSNIKSADPITYDDNGEIIPLSERGNEGNVDIRWSVTPEMDAEYLKAVEDNDMTKAQEMVDEAAERAMPYTETPGKWYHGTDDDFNTFNFSQGGKNGIALGYGIYLTDDKKEAGFYGDRVIEGYVNITKPMSETTRYITKEDLEELIGVAVRKDIASDPDFYAESDDPWRDTWLSNYIDTYDAGLYEEAVEEVTNWLLDSMDSDIEIIDEIIYGAGYDYETVPDFYDALTRITGIDGMVYPENTVAIAFRSSQVKSAEPVEYDDDGNVIPLSERFNQSNEDIRFSLSQQIDDDYFKALDDGDMNRAAGIIEEAAKRSGYTIHAYHGSRNFGFTKFDSSKLDDNISIFATDDVRVAMSYAPGSIPRTIDEGPEYRVVFPDYKDYFDPEEMEKALGIKYDHRKMKYVEQFIQEYVKQWEETGEYPGYLSTYIMSRFSDELGWKPIDYSTMLTKEWPWELYNAYQELGNAYSNAYMKHQKPGAMKIGGIYDAYLKMTNPLELDAGGKFWDSIPSLLFDEEAVKARDKTKPTFDKFEEEYIAYVMKKARLIGDDVVEDIEKYDGDIHKIDVYLRSTGLGWDDILTPQKFVENHMSKTYDNVDDFRNDIQSVYGLGKYMSKTREVSEYAREHGYDGVIFHNLVDYGSTPEDGVYSPEDIYIVFNSSQFKSADPVTRDDNGDIIPPSERFNLDNEDIRFSLEQPVEKSGDLVAVHNITEDKLRSALKLGGLAMPSIGILKTSAGPNWGYGKISFLFSTDSIDPKLSNDNRIYEGDAFTPMFPRGISDDATLDEIVQNMQNSTRGKSANRYVEEIKSIDEVKANRDKIANSKKDMFDHYPYFEAKAYRAVPFSEIKAAVIPEDLPEDLKNEIQNLGFPVYEYTIDGSMATKTTKNNRRDEVNKAADDLDLRFSMAGKNAVGADFTMMSWAEQLYQTGFSPEEIKEMTGHTVDTDGHAKFEFSDKDMSFNIPMKELKANPLKYKDGSFIAYENGGKWKFDLGDIINHTALFKYYPRLKNAEIIIVKPSAMKKIAGSANVLGSANIVNDSYKIHLNSEQTKDEMLGTLLHEIQHIIQGIEGFSSGANSRMWSKIRHNLVKKIKAIEDFEEDYVDGEWILPKYGTKSFFEDGDVAEKIRSSEEYKKSGENEYLRLIDLYKKLENASKNAISRIVNVDWNTGATNVYTSRNVSDYDSYYYTKGEIEARETSDRRNFDQEFLDLFPREANPFELKVEDYKEFLDDDYFDKDSIRYSMSPADLTFPGMLTKDYIETEARVNGYEPGTDAYNDYVKQQMEDEYRFRQYGETHEKWKPFREYMQAKKALEDYLETVDVPATPEQEAEIDRLNDKLDEAEKVFGVDVESNEFGHMLDEVTVNIRMDYDASQQQESQQQEPIVLYGEPPSMFDFLSDDEIVAMRPMPSDEEIEDYMVEHPEEYPSDGSLLPRADRQLADSKRRREDTMQAIKDAADYYKAVDKAIENGEFLDMDSVAENLMNLVKVTMLQTESRKKYKQESVDILKDAARLMYTKLREDDLDAVSEIAYTVCHNIIENADLVIDDNHDDYDRLKEYLKHTWIKTPDPKNFTDFAQWRRRNFGRIKIANYGAPIDTIWGELCSEVPGIFDPDDTSGEESKLKQIEYALDTLKPYAEAMTSEEMNDLIETCATDLAIIVAENGKPWRPDMDRLEAYEAREKNLKARLEQAKMKNAELVKQKNAEKREAVRQAKETERAKAKEQVAEARAKGKEKLEAQKAKDKEKLEAQKAKDKEKIDEAKAKANQKVSALKEKQKEKDKQRKEREKRNKAWSDITEDIKWLHDRLVKPSKDKYILEQLRKPVADMLICLDPQSARSKELEQKYGKVSKKRQTWLEYKALYEKISRDAQGFTDNGFEIPVELLEDMETLHEELDDMDLAYCNTAQLLKVRDILRSITHGIRYENKAFDEAGKMGPRAAAKDVISEAEVAKGYKHHNKIVKMNNTFITFASSVDVFGQLGGTLKDVFDPLLEGIGKEVNLDLYVRAAFDEITKPYSSKRKGGGSAMEDWRKQKIKYTLQSGETVEITPSQIMCLYAHSLSDHSMGHLCEEDGGQGMTLTDPRSNHKISRFLTGRINKSHKKTYQLAKADITGLIEHLSEDQIKVTNQLLDLMHGLPTDLANEVSMRMFGIEMYKTPNYMPISSERASISTDFNLVGEANPTVNPSFSKQRVKGAHNAIVIDDVFDVITGHLDKLGKYIAYAPALRDFQRTWNMKNEDGVPVKRAVEEAYGHGFVKFTEDLVRYINGTNRQEDTPVAQFIQKQLANYKKATIGGSGSVAVQQPTAIMRANMYIDFKYFAGVTNPKATYREMMAHVPLAQWKAWGYSDIDLARTREEILMNREFSRLDKATLGVYTQLDMMTWGAIWEAVKRETTAKKKLIRGSDKWWDAVEKRFNDVINRTQVVDSPFHRADIMRDMHWGTKTLLAFRAEPLKTFCLLMSGYQTASRLSREGDKKGARKVRAKTTRVFVANAVLVTAAASLIYAIRDHFTGDDDEKKAHLLVLWWQEFLEHINSNLNPLALLPITGDVMEGLAGWDPQNMSLMGLVKTFRSLKDLWNRDKPLGKRIRNFIESLGYLTGVPVKNLWRDIEIGLKVLGIDLPTLAADDDVKDDQEKADKNILDKIEKLFDGHFNGDDKDKKDDKGEKAEGKTEAGSGSEHPFLDKFFDNKGIFRFKVKDGSTFDNILNHFGINLTKEEKEKIAYDEKLAQVKEKAAGLEGDKNERLWTAITRKNQKEGNIGLTTAVSKCDYKTIMEMRQLFIDAGGDEKYFDEHTRSKLEGAVGDYCEKGDYDSIRNLKECYTSCKGKGEEWEEMVMKKSKTAFMKTIGDDDLMEEQDTIRNYLLDHGMTEVQISRKLVCKSDTAKKFREACRAHDAESAEDTLTSLILAGVTKDDIYYMYENRNKGQKYEDYMTGELMSPTQGKGSIKSGFGHRASPGGIGSKYHEAIDIGVPEGTDVVAADGGKVIAAGWNGGYGYSVTIAHTSDESNCTQYSHLKEYYFEEGDWVKKGTVIAASGNTGSSTGPHLDFKVKLHGKWVDAREYVKGGLCY